MMNHENIAKILDVGTSNFGQPYFLMELVQGIPFNKWCDTNKRLILDWYLSASVVVPDSRLP